MGDDRPQRYRCGRLCKGNRAASDSRGARWATSQRATGRGRRGPPATTLSPTSPSWREILAPYARPRLGRSLLDVASSVVPTWRCRRRCTWRRRLLPAGAGDRDRCGIPGADVHPLPLLLARLVPGLQARQHAGRAPRRTVLRVPRSAPRHDHAIHHATSGDLDRRGGGDVRTLTVANIRRCRRVDGWDTAFSAIRCDVRDRPDRRAPDRAAAGGVLGAPAHAPQRARSPDLGAGGDRPGRSCWDLLGARFLLVQASTWSPAGWLGLALLRPASVRGCLLESGAQPQATRTRRPRGSSYSKLPKLLQFFSGNIWPAPRPPPERPHPKLQPPACARREPIFPSGVPTISLADGLRAVRLKLWDEDRRRMVTFAEARAIERARPVISWADPGLRRPAR